jgi:hypothetical protein
VTCTPAEPLDGDTETMLDGTDTVNSTPLLATPLTVTTTFPVIAPLGTVARMLEAVQP